MTIRTILVQLLVLLSINSFSQTGKFIIKPCWKQGEKKELNVSGEQFWNMFGNEDKVPVPIERYLIEVLESNADGYLIQWKVISDDNLSTEENFMQDYINNFYYEILLDSKGVFVELKNWKELITLNKDLKDKIVSLAKSKDISKAEIDQQIAQMNLPFTKDKIIDWYQGLTDIYLSIYGEEFILNTINESPTKVPNEILKDGIPATEVIETKNLSDNLISIKYSTIYDNAVIEKLFKENFPNQEYQELKMNSSTEYIYNSETGWIDEIKIAGVNGTKSENAGFRFNYEIK